MVGGKAIIGSCERAVRRGFSSFSQLTCETRLDCGPHRNVRVRDYSDGRIRFDQPEFRKTFLKLSPRQRARLAQGRPDGLKAHSV